MAQDAEWDPQTKVELAVLQKYGLRWAVLAAWDDELRRSGRAAIAEVAKKVEAARVKIASGCFSSCEVGCDLPGIERLLAIPAVRFQHAACGFGRCRCSA